MREPESVYFNSDKFLEDMRNGSLHEDFTLTSDAFQELVTKINAFTELAAEIVENEILLILASSGKSEVDGILALAGVCCGNKSDTGTTGQRISQASMRMPSQGDILDSLVASYKAEDGSQGGTGMEAVSGHPMGIQVASEGLQDRD